MMKAARLVDKLKFEICEIPGPLIKYDTDVLIRVSAVGVCGSDVHYYKNGNIGEQVITFPFIIGHEMAGVVEKTGSGVKKVKPGDKIAVDPAVSCHTCDQCLGKRPHTCRNLKFLGCPGQLEGCFSEFIVLPEQCCYPIPDKMSPETAALCEPLTIGYYAVKRAGDVKNKRIGILGAGPIGLSVMLSCKYKGAEKIYITDKLDYRCDIAKKNGAEWAGNPDVIDVVDTILQQEPLELDVVFECCGKQEAFDQAFLLLKPGGILSVIGIPEFTHYRFLADKARRKEICIRHVRRQNDCTEPVIEAVGRGHMNPDFMITHHFPLKDISDAFHLVSGYNDNVVKAMIHM